VQISPYKSAADVLTKSKMSDELREQLRWLLQSQNDELLAAVSDGRKIDRSAAQQLVDGSPYNDDQALAKHLSPNGSGNRLTGGQANRPSGNAISQATSREDGR